MNTQTTELDINLLDKSKWVQDKIIVQVPESADSSGAKVSFRHFDINHRYSPPFNGEHTDYSTMNLPTLESVTYNLKLTPNKSITSYPVISKDSFNWDTSQTIQRTIEFIEDEDPDDTFARVMADANTWIHSIIDSEISSTGNYYSAQLRPFDGEMKLYGTTSNRLGFLGYSGCLTPRALAANNLNNMALGAYSVGVYRKWMDSSLRYYTDISPNAASPTAGTVCGFHGYLLIRSQQDYNEFYVHPSTQNRYTSTDTPTLTMYKNETGYHNVASFNFFQAAGYTKGYGLLSQSDKLVLGWNPNNSQSSTAAATGFCNFTLPLDWSYSPCPFIFGFVIQPQSEMERIFVLLLAENGSRVRFVLCYATTQSGSFANGSTYQLRESSHGDDFDPDAIKSSWNANWWSWQMYGGVCHGYEVSGDDYVFHGYGKYNSITHEFTPLIEYVCHPSWRVFAVETVDGDGNVGLSFSDHQVVTRQHKELDTTSIQPFKSTDCFWYAAEESAFPPSFAQTMYDYTHSWTGNYTCPSTLTGSVTVSTFTTRYTISNYEWFGKLMDGTNNFTCFNFSVWDILSHRIGQPINVADVLRRTALFTSNKTMTWNFATGTETGSGDYLRMRFNFDITRPDGVTITTNNQQPTIELYPYTVNFEESNTYIVQPSPHPPIPNPPAPPSVKPVPRLYLTSSWFPNQNSVILTENEAPSVKFKTMRVTNRTFELQIEDATGKVYDYDSLYLECDNANVQLQIT